jgi:signal transduction histidine kinase
MTEFQADVAAIQKIDAVPRILDVACRVTGMGFAAVARVTEDRWICCSARDQIAFGLSPGGELKIETTLCNEIRGHGEPIIIDHVAQDAAWRAHPTPAMYGFQSYISMPIRLEDGTFWGTLCAIDPQPRRVNTPETIEMFRLFAELIATHLDAVQRYETERKIAERREQFIAVLGHDLRNPLASIDAGTRYLQRKGFDERTPEVLTLMQRAVLRMSTLVDNVMDLARGRLAGGIRIVRNAAQPLTPVLEQVIAELHAVWPERKLETNLAVAEPVSCDRHRIGRLLSNLLGNAIAYGDADRPIRIEGRTGDNVFELSVANSGKPIPPETLEKLFAPFARGGEVKSNKHGLGLGLYIASEIAKAHGGTLTATSTVEETRFTFKMPL